ALAAKPQIVAANKMDAVTDETEAGVTALAERAAALGLPFLRVSAATGAGMPELLEAMWRHIALEREAEHAAAGPAPAGASGASAFSAARSIRFTGVTSRRRSPRKPP